MTQHRDQHRSPSSVSGRIESLTRTERVVLAWVEQGKRNSEIGLILGRSVRTVECHVAAILQKLGVETRGAAASAFRGNPGKGLGADATAQRPANGHRP